MPANAQDSSRPPLWALAILLATLGMLGPFSIDTYIPAFAAIAQSLQATPVQMQQTLSAYLFGYAFMNLFHGALSDSFGRRPVILCGLAVFTLASVGCALSQNVGQLVAFRALQGLSTGAGIVVSRAVVRDVFPLAEAQRVMSQITILFGIAPAVAPVVGGLIVRHLHWAAIFWFMAGIGATLWLVNWRVLPETLPPAQRQRFRLGPLLHGYRVLLLDARFMLLALASGVPFNGLFLYVLAAPAFLGRILRLPPTQFFCFFLVAISGIMAGSWLSGRQAGRIAPKQQVMQGFRIMLAASLVNVAANHFLAPAVWWSVWPIAVFALGWALTMPAVTLLALDLHPQRRGMASSLQAAISSAANGTVAGLLVPLVMQSAQALALASCGLMLVGLAAWLWLRHRWPQIG
ncbi:MAG: multidrug effflux MFS transporter [Brachymonas sp.]|nr:multidrug effflux MFS transporter [Brachymonas sp.]